MFEFFMIIFFLWLMIRAIGFALKLTWGVAKIAASLLMVVALPVLVLCLLFAGGLLLIIPVILVGIAAGILKSCLNA